MRSVNYTEEGNKGGQFISDDLFLKKYVLLWKDKVGASPEDRSLRPAWPTQQNPISTKNTKISRVWWDVPVVLATLEAEAGESLKSRRWRLW